MKTIAAIVSAFLGAWLQSALFGHFRPLGVIPNVMLVFVAVFALWSDATPALVMALVGGLLLDLASGQDFGMRMGFYLVMVLGVVAAKQVGLQSEALVTSIALVALGTILFDLVVLASFKGAISGFVIGEIARELAVNLCLLGLLELGRINFKLGGIGLSMNRGLRR